MCLKDANASERRDETSSRSGFEGGAGVFTGVNASGARARLAHARRLAAATPNQRVGSFPSPLAEGSAPPPHPPHSARRARDARDGRARSPSRPGVTSLASCAVVDRRSARAAFVRGSFADRGFLRGRASPPRARRRPRGIVVVVRARSARRLVRCRGATPPLQGKCGATPRGTATMSSCSSSAYDALRGLLSPWPGRTSRRSADLVQLPRAVAAEEARASRTSTSASSSSWTSTTPCWTPT